VVLVTDFILKTCSICNKISATGDDHLDCKEKRRIELEDAGFKNKLLEKLDLAKNSDDLSVDIKAVLEHLAKNKEKKNS